MATVSPVANWYEDPSGRHEGRFWDGHTWTAHVFDAGIVGIDPPSTARAATEATGTPDADTRTDRRTLFGMTIPSVVGLAVLAVVAAVGISATGLLQAGSGTPPPISTTVSATGDGFSAEVPLGWAEATAPAGSPFDAFYTTPGLGPIVVGLADISITEAQLGDATTRTQTLDLVAGMIAAQFGQVERVAGHQTGSFGGRQDDFITVAVAYPDGGSGQVAQYFVVGPERSVVVVASGTERNVARHLQAITAMARSVALLR